MATENEIKLVPSKLINNVMDMSQFDIDSENDYRRNHGKPNMPLFDGLTEKATAEFDPIVFQSFGNFMRMNNRQLSEIIKENYQKIFHDLKGVFIDYVPNSPQPFVTSFYFSKNNALKESGKIENLRDLTRVDSGDANNFFSKMKAMENKTANKNYTLSDATKLILSDVMFGPKGHIKPNSKEWSRYVNQVWVPSNDPTWGPRSGELVLVVSGCFDIHKLLNKVMPKEMVSAVTGQTTADGSVIAKNHIVNASYELRYIKHDQQDPKLFYMNLEQFDRDAVANIYAIENPVRRVAPGMLFYY